MSPRKRIGKADAARGLSAGRVILWSVLILETIWLIAFILGTGSPLPPRLGSRSPSGAAAGWDATKESQFEDLQIQKILNEKGSRGNNGNRGK